jgi:hypothetical protein
MIKRESVGRILLEVVSPVEQKDWQVMIDTKLVFERGED